MASPEGSPLFNPENFELCFELPRAYTLVYKWGQCVVSRAAHADYGIAPLAGEIIRDGIETPPLPDKAIEIALLGATEFEPPPEAIRHARGGAVTTRAYTSGTVNQNRTVQVVASYENTAREMLEAELYKRSIEAGVSVEEFVERFAEAKSNIPATEFLAHEIPNTLTHRLLDPIYGILLRFLPEQDFWLTRSAKKRLGRYILKASGVAEDIHASFCREYFAHTLEQSLPE